MFLLKQLRDVYHLHKLKFERWEKLFHIIILLLTTLYLIAIPLLKKAIPDTLKQDPFVIILNRIDLDLPKMILEWVLLLYFAFLVFFTKIVSWLLDPINEYFNTATELPQQLSKIDFEIISQVKEEDIPIITKIAVELWGEQYFEFRKRNDVYTEWYNTNPDIFSLVYVDKVPVGFISVLPLSNESHFRYQVDILNIGQSSINHLAYSSEFVYIHGIYLEKAYQSNTALVSAMQAELTRKITLFLSEKLCYVYITGRYTSIKRFFSKNGFGQINKRAPIPTFYYLPIENYRAYKRKQLLKRIKFRGKQILII